MSTGSNEGSNQQGGGGGGGGGTANRNTPSGGGPFSMGLVSGGSNSGGGPLAGILSPAGALEHYRLSQLYQYAMAAERLRLPPHLQQQGHGPGAGGFQLQLPPGIRPELAPLFYGPYCRIDPRLAGLCRAPEEPKPQQSYIGLIAMAILSSPDKKLVLSDIYQYILDNFPYFRSRGPGWRNSIRHNLSLNDCFIKSGRSANGKGRCHYWAIHPANVDDFTKGDFRRRRAQRKVRKHMGLAVEDEDSPSPPPISPPPTSWPPHLPINLSLPPPPFPYGPLAVHPQHHHHHPPSINSLSSLHPNSQLNNINNRKRQFDVASLLAHSPSSISPSPRSPRGVKRPFRKGKGTSGEEGGKKRRGSSNKESIWGDEDEDEEREAEVVNEDEEEEIEVTEGEEEDLSGGVRVIIRGQDGTSEEEEDVEESRNTPSSSPEVVRRVGKVKKEGQSEEYPFCKLNHGGSHISPGGHDDRGDDMAGISSRGLLGGGGGEASSALEFIHQQHQHLQHQIQLQQQSQQNPHHHHHNSGSNNLLHQSLELSLEAMASHHHHHQQHHHQQQQQNAHHQGYLTSSSHQQQEDQSSHGGGSSSSGQNGCGGGGGGSGFPLGSNLLQQNPSLASLMILSSRYRQITSNLMNNTTNPILNHLPSQNNNNNNKSSPHNHP